jgi:hypothetical protein
MSRCRLVGKGDEAPIRGKSDHLETAIQLRNGQNGATALEREPSADEIRQQP